MQAIGELDNENADVLSGSNQKLQEVVAGFGEVAVEVFHAAAGLAELCYAINKEGDVMAELFLDILECNVGIFDGVVQNAGNNRVIIHVPLFEDFLHC